MALPHRATMQGSAASRFDVSGASQWRPRARRPRPQTAGRPVLRKVDTPGAVSFAATTCRVGDRYRGSQVEVRLVGDTVEISRGA